MDLGVYPINLLRFVIGTEPTSVESAKCETRPGNPLVDVATTAILRFPSPTGGPTPVVGRFVASFNASLLEVVMTPFTLKVRLHDVGHPHPHPRVAATHPYASARSLASSRRTTGPGYEGHGRNDQLDHAVDLPQHHCDAGRRAAAGRARVRQRRQHLLLAAERYAGRCRSEPWRTDGSRRRHPALCPALATTAFVDAVRKQAPFSTTADDAACNMAVVDAVYKKAGLPIRGTPAP